MGLANIQSIHVGQQRSAAVTGINGLPGMVWGSWCLRQRLPLHQQSTWMLEEPSAVSANVGGSAGCAGCAWELALEKSKTLELLKTCHPSWKLSFVVHVFITWCLGQGVQGAWAEP